MYFAYYNGSRSSALNGFYYWRQTTDTFGRIADAFDVGITATGIFNIPTNAAFAFGTYFYIRNFQNVLAAISVVYNSTTTLPIGAVSVANYTIAAPPTQTTNMRFGDIAIDPGARQLYASTSTGQFFRVDLSNLENPGGLPFVELAPPGSIDSVQIGKCGSRRSAPLIDIMLRPSSDF